MGARKIVLFGLAPIGCTPNEISIYRKKEERCVKSINDAVEVFNNKLRLLVDKLNHHKHDAKFTFINVTHISLVQQGKTRLKECIRNFILVIYLKNEGLIPK